MKNFSILLSSFLLLSCTKDEVLEIDGNRFVFENNANRKIDSIVFTNSLHRGELVVRQIDVDTQVEGVLKNNENECKNGYFHLEVYTNGKLWVEKDFGTLNAVQRGTKYYIALDESGLFEVEEL